MRIEKLSANELCIHENIKTIDDFLKINAQVTAMVEGGTRELTLAIPDSISMPSSVIGLLLKLKNHEKVRIGITIGDGRLLELLDELNLVAELGARLQR